MKRVAIITCNYKFPFSGEWPPAAKSKDSMLMSVHCCWSALSVWTAAAGYWDHEALTCFLSSASTQTPRWIMTLTSFLLHSVYLRLVGLYAHYTSIKVWACAVLWFFSECPLSVVSFTCYHCVRTVSYLDFLNPHALYFGDVFPNFPHHTFTIRSHSSPGLIWSGSIVLKSWKKSSLDAMYPP